MKYLPLFAFVLFCSGSYSQQVFNKVYDNNSLYDGAFGIIHDERSDNWIISGPSFDLQSYDASFIFKLNSTGDTIWKKEIDLTSGEDAIYGSCFSKDGNYMFTGLTNDSTNTGLDVLLLKVDTNGNIVWTKRYGGAGDDYAQMVKLTSDGGFIIAGWTFTNTTGLEDAYAIKTDSLGNELWSKQYGLHYTDGFYSVDLTKDGGFIFGGQSNSFGNHLADLYLVKTDSLGQLEWYKTYGGPNDDFGYMAIATEDGGYAFCGSSEVQLGVDFQAYLIKTDSIGTEQWHVLFGEDTLDEDFHRILQLPDQNFIIAGNDGRNNLEGMLSKYSVRGDSLWTRFYRHNLISPYNQNYFFGLTLLPDSRIGACGFTVQNQDPQKNDMWLVVTDSLGCDSSLCLLQSSIAGNDLENSIRIFPNPVTNELHLSSSIPFTGKLIIRDYLGKVVYDEQFTSSNTFDISKLMSGIYIIELKTENGMYQSKLLKYE